MLNYTMTYTCRNYIFFQDNIRDEPDIVFIITQVLSIYFINKYDSLKTVFTFTSSTNVGKGALYMYVFHITS